MAAPDSMAEPLLKQHLSGNVLRLTLANPNSRNALSDAMMAALQAALDVARTSREVRAIVIAAEGPVFCAGHDLKEMTARRSEPDGGRAAFADVMGRCATLMTSIVRQPQPVIAEVQGIATAAGLQLVASCDLAVAAEGARFCTPGVSIGLFCSTPMVALSRNVPRKAAMEMLLTGDMIDAETARSWGLINRVVPLGDLMTETMSLAASIAGRAGRVVRIGKEAFARQAEMSLDDAYAHCAAVMVENMLMAEAEAGISAFSNKRPPNWPQP